MAYAIKLEVTIETAGGEDIANSVRFYDVTSLDKLPGALEHFSRSTVLLLEGADLGCDPANSHDDASVEAT